MTVVCIRWQACCEEVQLKKTHVLGNKETYRTSSSQLSAWLRAEQMAEAERFVLLLSPLAWLVSSKVFCAVSENCNELV